MIRDVSDSPSIQASVQYAEGTRRAKQLRVLVVDSPVLNAIRAAVEVAYEDHEPDSVVDELLAFFGTKKE